MLFYVYVVTNTINGKVYVGKSCDPATRWRQHARAAKRGSDWLMSRAIRKYGIDAFRHDVVATCRNHHDALETEKSVIRQWNSDDLNLGYNMTPGGDGCTGDHPETTKRRRDAAIARGNESLRKAIRVSVEKRLGKPMPEATRQKIREANTGRKFQPEFGAKVRAAMLGHTVSAETRAKISASKRGRPGIPMTEQHKALLRERNKTRVVTDETRAKMRAAKVGRKLSPEHAAKIGAALRGRQKKPMSEETRAKISRAKLGSKHSDETRKKMSESHCARLKNGK